MGSEIRSPWTLLEANDSRRVPLFYRFQADGTGYCAQLTDFTDVWEESLPKAEIVDKARRIDSSIDPSQDDSQLFVIYEKLEDALAARAPTSLTIDEDSSHSVLSVHAKCDLPKPLRPFKWKLRFTQCPRSFLRDAIFAPLARLCHQKSAQIEALLRLLTEKDDALSRILDKADSAGLDASAIFPSARFRPDEVLTRKLLIQRVKALRRFNQDDLERVADATKSEPELEQLFANALSGVVPSDLPAIPQVSASDSQKGFNESPPADEDSDEYQRQATPPPRTISAPPQSSSPLENQPNMDLDDDETTDEGESEQARNICSPAKAPTHPPLSPTPSSRRRIGTIASRKISSPSNGSAPADKTVPLLEQAVTKPTKSRIGSLGGKKAPGGKRRGSDNDAQLEETSTVLRSKLESNAVAEVEDRSVHDVTEARPTSDEPAITEEEKANEKRAQLKRDLERQSKTASKKKRRF